MSSKFAAAANHQSVAMETGDHFKNEASPKSQTSRGNFILFTMLAFVVGAFVLTGCKKCDCEKDDDKVEVDERGLTRDIRTLIPEDILNEVEDMGMPIYGGNTPPDITGTFFVSPTILLASNFNDNEKPGKQFTDARIVFSEQNNKDLTVKVLQIQSSTEGEGVGGFLVGTGKNFTVFVGLTNVDEHGHRYKSAMLYSGTMSSEGIRNMYLSTVMVNDGGDPYNDLIGNGQGRLFYDSDGLSERISSSSTRAASPVQQVTVSSPKTLLSQ